MTEPDTQAVPTDRAKAAAIESAAPDSDLDAHSDMAATSAAAAEVSDVDAEHDEQVSIDESGIDPNDRRHRKPNSRGQVVAFVVLPLLLMGIAVGAGYLKYQDGSVKDGQTAATSSVQAATEGTIALLSYTPDTAQATLTAARDRLTGAFRDSYTSLTNDVVIPGAKQKQISATATVPAASSVIASETHAVVLVFVDQSVIVGNDAPSATASAVQVTLDKSGDRWLITGFDPK
jgi:Mce-associated membrane protein